MPQSSADSAVIVLKMSRKIRSPRSQPAPNLALRSPAWQTALLGLIRRRLRGDFLRREGASGAAVVADKSVFIQIKSQQHRKLLGIDMEAYGVMSSAVELPAPAPECFVL